MSIDFGTFVGMGYLLTEKERAALMDPISQTNPQLFNQIMDNLWCYNENEDWFFGERIHTFNCWGEAKRIETLAALSALQNDGTFGLKYGEMLIGCGLSVEEINTKWGKPNIYIVTYCYW